MSKTDDRTRRGCLQTLIRTGYPDRPDGCWLWTGAKMNKGYGVVWFGGRMQLTHRVAYELHVGPVPDGLMLDHACYDPACFNPAHLEPVTNAQNMQNRAGLDANNTSGHRGVSWDKRRSRWLVRVMLNGVHHHGGRFRDLDDAAAAAERLREELGVRDTSRRSTQSTGG